MHIQDESNGSDSSNSPGAEADNSSALMATGGQSEIPTEGSKVSAHKPGFTRALGLVDSTAVVVGSMIGSGIFIVSADIARNLGSPFWLLACWAIAGILTIMAALCYSELAAMYPHAGGQYVFLREAYGPMAAFLYGWTLFMVIQSGTIAAVGVAFSKFLGVFLPFLSNKNILLQMHLADLPVSFGSFAGPLDWKLSAGQLVSVLLIAFLTAVNCRGIHTAKLIQTTFTATKVGALIALIALGLFAAGKSNAWDLNMANFWQATSINGEPLEGVKLLAVLCLAMVGSLFSCDAWNNLTFASEEVHSPEKTLPRSLALGTCIVVSLYILANIVYLMLLPLHGTADGATILERGIQYASEDRVGTAAAQVIFGPVGEFIMAAAIMISTFGCLNGLILAGPRAYYAMAKDRLFFAKAAELHPKFHVPVFGLVLQGIWSCLLATSGTYSQLLEYIVFAALLFYVLTVAALFVLRRTKPNEPRPYKVFAYPLMPAVYVIASVIVMIGQIALSPVYSGAGLLIILSGLPAYFWWHSRQKA